MRFYACQGKYESEREHYNMLSLYYMSWNEHENTYVQFMETQCRELYTRNMEDYEYYESLARRFNIPIIVLSAINSLCAVILNQFVGQVYVSIVNSVLSASVGVAGSVQLYLKVNEKMNVSLRSAMAFNKISLKIAREICVPVKERTSKGGEFVSECFLEFLKTVEQGNPAHISGNHLHTDKETPQKPLGLFARLFQRSESSRGDYAELNV